ncbi:MAG: hypothetical protein D6776_03495 [Planctomycetota bacterium]|nr:MAG: hypothetical protein D6776_03495 [Planctomycetota bacterium]
MRISRGAGQRLARLACAITVFVLLVGARASALPVAAIAGREIEAVVRARARSLAGWPVVDGLTACFVLQAPGPGPYTVAGSWSRWDPAAHFLQRIGNTSWWFACVRLPAHGRYEYKFVDLGTGRWFADPLNRKRSYDHGNSVLQTARSPRGHLEWLGPWHAPGLRGSREVIVYLPPGALYAHTRYPVLYLHDGQNAFDPAAPWGGWQVDRIVDGLIARGEIRPLIVVAIAIASGADRIRDYTPVPDDLSPRCDGSRVAGGGAAAYADAVALDLKPRIDALYPTRPGREHTAVLGSSLGGLVALYTAYRHPDVFGMAGGMSPTLGWGGLCRGEGALFELARRRGRIPVRLYLDSGGTGAADPGADNWDVTRAFAHLLATQGYRRGRDLLYRWEPGAAHNEAAWRARLPALLRAWFHR